MEGFAVVRTPTIPDLVLIAEEAGTFVCGLFLQKQAHDTQYKDDQTPFSKADTGANEIIVHRMAERFPDIPIVAEEGGRGRRTGARGEYWLLVDDIDGSTGFILGIPTFATMLTLMRGDRPIKTVIYDPILRRAFTAEEGGGAYLNAVPIKVADRMPKNPMVGICAWPERGKHDMLLKGMVNGITTTLHDRGYCFTNCCSIGYFDALVASGDLMATIFAGQHAHDTAAGDLLVREAGGIAVDLRGCEIHYDKPYVAGHIFTSRVVADELFGVVGVEVARDPSRINTLFQS